MTDTPIGTLIDEMFEIRENKRALTADLKTINADLLDLEHRILETMKVIGTDTARTNKATVTAVNKQNYSVEDYNEFIQWILESPEDRIYIFTRALNQPAYEELKKINEDILPGTKLFEQEKISMLTRNK